MCAQGCKWGFPGVSVVKNLPASAGDTGPIPGSGRSPGGGRGNPLQCSCLENPMDRGARRATVHGVAESDTTDRLTHTQIAPYFLSLYPQLRDPPANTTS